jgi:hypothetical protein
MVTVVGVISTETTQAVFSTSEKANPIAVAKITSWPSLRQSKTHQKRSVGVVED